MINAMGRRELERLGLEVGVAVCTGSSEKISSIR